MRNIAGIRGKAHRIGALSLAGAALLAIPAAATQVAQAASASKPPTITSSFTPALIATGGTSAIGFTITDPNASGTLSNVGFSDTLGGSGVVDNPNGLNTSGCGSSVAVTANPGANTIGVAGASIKAGTPCVISVAVTASTAETVDSQTSVVSSSAGNSTYGAAAVLSVLAPPTITIASPGNNASYKFGQVVHVNFSCAQAYDTLGLEGCTAQDDLGNTIADGGVIDTRIPGQHSLTVQAFSISGAVADDTVNYTVLPNNRFTLKGLKAKGTHVSFKLALPGAGKVKVAALIGRKTISTETLKITGKRKLTVTLTVAGSAAKIKLVVKYTPTGGVAASVTKHLSIT